MSERWSPGRTISCYTWVTNESNRACQALYNIKGSSRSAHVHATCWRYNHSGTDCLKSPLTSGILKSNQGSPSSVDWEKAIKLWAACCREETRSALLLHWFSRFFEGMGMRRTELAALIEGKLRERQWVKEKDGQRQSELRAQLSKLEMRPVQVKKRLARDAFGGVGLRQSDSPSDRQRVQTRYSNIELNRLSCWLRSLKVYRSR